MSDFLSAFVSILGPFVWFCVVVVVVVGGFVIWGVRDWKKRKNAR